MEKLLKKAIEQSSIRKGSPMKGVESMAGRIWGKGIFKFRVKKSRSDGQWVVMMGQISLENSIEKSEKKNDQD